MKIACRATAFGLIGFALAGCSSTQPDRIDTRGASLAFATKALVPLYNCWNLQQDTNQDGTPDVDYGIVCEPALEDHPPFLQLRGERDVPWRYSVKITVIRTGTTTEELVTSSDGIVGSSVQPFDNIDDFISLTDYDPDMPPIPSKSQGDLYWVNGHLVSTASPIYLSTVFIDPGIPNLLGPPETTFDFDLNTGDTVIVRARKQAFSQAPAFIPADPNPEIKTTGLLSVQGVGVAPLGSITTSGDDQAGITFSFTVR